MSSEDIVSVPDLASVARQPSFQELSPGKVSECLYTISESSLVGSLEQCYSKKIKIATSTDIKIKWLKLKHKNQESLKLK